VPYWRTKPPTPTPLPPRRTAGREVARNRPTRAGQRGGGGHDTRAAAALRVNQRSSFVLLPCYCHARCAPSVCYCSYVCFCFCSICLLSVVAGAIRLTEGNALGSNRLLCFVKHHRILCLLCECQGAGDCVSAPKNTARRSGHGHVRTGCVDILPTKVTSGGASAAVSACASTSGARVHVAGGGGLVATSTCAMRTSV
jgi:hypothetical protein